MDVVKTDILEFTIQMPPKDLPIALMMLNILILLLSAIPSFSRKFSTIFSSDGSLQVKILNQKQKFLRCFFKDINPNLWYENVDKGVMFSDQPTMLNWEFHKTWNRLTLT